MYRFFLEKSKLEDIIRITGADYEHISRSLRLNLGDEIIVNPGDGWDYIAQLTEFSKQEVQAKIIKKYRNENEPKIKVTIAQAIPKKNKFDLIVEKSTEIGVSKIIPLLTKRTIVKLDDQKKLKKQNRWQRISREASKQSNRGKIPEIMPVSYLKDLAKFKEEYDLILVAWVEEKKQGLKDIYGKLAKDKLDNILLIIGPEGGFREEEITMLKSLGAYSINLGPRILRTETAPLVLLSLVLYEAGELGG